MSGAHLSATAFRAGPAYQRAIAAWLPRARAALRRSRALRALSGPRAGVPTALPTVPHCPRRRLTSRTPSGPRAHPVRSRLPAVRGSPPLLSERRADVVVAGLRRAR
jgi:hypothetical protein